MDETTVELNKPFSYAHKGEQQEASFITLVAPTYKQIDKIVPIKQALTAAIAQMHERDFGGDDGAQDGGGSITGAQVMQLLYLWDGNLAGVFIHAQELFKTGAALVDGESKLTVPLMEKMDPVDFERLVGEYIASFLAPSLMAGE